MTSQAIIDLLSNSLIIFLLQVAIFALPLFYITSLRRDIRSTAVYTYLGIVLVIGGFLGAVYSIPLTETITISGGNLAYGAFMYAAILLVIIEDNLLAMRNVIRLVVTVNVLKYILFSAFSWLLSLNTIINPFDTAPDLFGISAKFMILGGALIIFELLLLLYYFERIKTRVKNYYALSFLYIIGFIAVLLLDGVLFPFFAFGFDSSLVQIVVGGFIGKLVMALAYSLPLLAFLLIFRNRLKTYLETPIIFRELLTASREKLLAEIDRQQAVVEEQALRLQTIVQAANVGLWDWDLRTNTVQYSPEWKSQIGYEDHEITNEFSEWESRIHPDDLEQAVATVQAYLDDSWPKYQNEYRFRHKDGVYRWILAQASLLTDEDGKPCRMLGSHIDITQTKEAQEKLRQSKNRLSMAIEATHLGIYEHKVPLGDDTYHSERWAEIFGFTLAELPSPAQRFEWVIGRVHPGDLSLLEKANSDFIEGRTPGYEVEIRMKHKSGAWVYVRSIARAMKRDSQGAVTHILGVMEDITKRKQAEEQIEDSQRQLKTLMSNLPGMAYRCLNEGNWSMEFVSEGCVELTGYRPHELVHNNTIAYGQLIHPDDQELLWQSVQSALNKRKPFEVTYRLFTAGEEEKWVWERGQGIYNQSNDPFVIEGFVQDITERRQAEKALQERENFLQAIFDNSLNAILVADDAGNYLSVNQSAADMFGYPVETLLQMSVADLRTISDSDAADRYLQYLAVGKEIGEFYFVRPDGEVRVAQYHAVRVGEDFNLSILMDITARKEQEQKLQYQAFLLTNVSEAIISTDVDFNIKTWNQAAAWLYGWHEEEVAGKQMNAIMSTEYPNDDANDVRYQLIQEGVWQGEVIHTRRDGNKRYILSTVSLLKNDKGKPVGAVAINRDISERKKVETELIQRNQFIETILDNLPIGLAVNNVDDGAVSYMNAEFEKTYGWPQEELSNVERFFHRVYPDPDYRRQVQEQIMADIESGDITRMSWDGFEITTQHGEKCIVSAKNIPLYDQNVMISIVQDITEQKLAQQHLQASEEQFRRLFYLMPAGVFTKDVDGRYTSTNDHRNIFTEESPLGLTDAEIQPPEIAATLHANDLAVLEKGETLVFEEQFVTPIGTRWLLSYKTPLHDETGQVVGILGASQDITARVLAQQQLQAYTQRLETLHQIDRAILSQDSPERIAQSAIKQLSKQIVCERITVGWIEEALQTMTILATQVKGGTQIGTGVQIPITTNGGELARLRQGKVLVVDDIAPFAGQSSVTDQILKERLHSYMAVPMTAGGQLIGNLGFAAREIGFFNTEHEALAREVADQLAIALQQARLREAEQAQRMLAETLQQTAVTLVGTLGLEETLETILNRLALVVKYDLAQVLLIQEEMLVVRALKGKLADKVTLGEAQPYNTSPLLSQTLQSDTPLILSAPQIEQNHFNLPGMVPSLSSWVGFPLIARDVTVGFLTVGRIDAVYLPRVIDAIASFAPQAALAIEKASILSELERSVNTLRETQAQMVRAARLTAIGETAAGVAHQINNPLTTVVIDSHLLLKNLPPSHPARPSADAIHQAALRAAGIVERMLDFSRTKPTTKQPTDLSKSIKDSAALLRAQIPEHIQIVLDLDPALPFVEASPEHLNDVWLNLLLNARDAVRQEKKGVITVTASYDMHYNTIKISIVDNGAGIPRDQQKKIFEPFYTTKTWGTGLGLAVCQDIISHHSGEIWVSSEVGQGSTFTVVLPV